MTQAELFPPTVPAVSAPGAVGGHCEQLQHTDPATGAGAGGRPDETELAELEKRRALSRHAARHGPRILSWQRELVRLLLERAAGEAALLEEVRARLGDPEGECRWLGAVTHGLAEAGVIERAGFTAGRRRVGHGAPRSLWRLASRQAGLSWLAAHPAPAESAGATS